MSRSRPPAINPLLQEANLAGVQGQLSNAPIVNVIESNRQIAMRENPNQVDKNYEWTTPINPAIQIKKDDAIMVSNVFINQRGSSSDVLDFTSQENNVNLNSKTKVIFSFYATDDGTTGKRRQIDISGLVPYVFNHTNSYNSMKMERAENSILQIFATDFTDINNVLWFDYYGTYEGYFDPTITNICIPRQDPWCDNRWFNTVGADIQDYTDTYKGLCLHSPYSQFKVYGRLFDDDTSELVIERLIGDTDEDHNPANFVKAGDTFLLEVKPGQHPQAISQGFPIGQYLQCVSSDWVNKKISMTEVSTRESVPVFECDAPAQTVIGTPTVIIDNVTTGVATNDRYLIQTGNLGTPVMTIGVNYKITALVGVSVTVSSNFIANLTGGENLVISPFPLHRDATTNTDTPPCDFRLVNTGYSAIDGLAISQEQSRGWNMNNLVNDKDEVYQYQINRLAAGTGWGSNITDRNTFKRNGEQSKSVGHIDGFTRFSTQKKAIHYNLTGHNPVTGFTPLAGSPLTIINVTGSTKELVLRNTGTPQLNPWGTTPSYTTTELPYMAWITTAKEELREAINPMTGTQFTNIEGVMYVDWRESPSYLWRLNSQSNIELYNYRTHVLDFTLTITKASTTDFFTPVNTDSSHVYSQQEYYASQFWNNNDVLTASTTSLIDNSTSSFTFDLDDEAVWSTVDSLLGATSRFFNTNSRLAIQVISPYGAAGNGRASALFSLDVGSSSADSYPRAGLYEDKSIWVKTNRKNVSVTNITRLEESNVGGSTAVFPIGSEVRIYDPSYRCSPILRVYNCAYNSYGLNNEYGTILSNKGPEYVRTNTDLFCRNNAPLNGSFEPVGNPISIIRSNIASHNLWVDHLISHTCDLEDATNLSPSDVGSIITKSFQEPEDIRISHENNVGLAIPRANRLHGLMIKNTQSRGIYMNKFYCNSWDAYENLTEDSSNWSGRSSGAILAGGFRFKIRYRNTPVYHNRASTSYDLRDGNYFDLYDDPTSPLLTAAGSYYNGDYLVYIRSTHTGLNVVNNTKFRSATMTATPTGNITFGSVTIPTPVKNDNYPITISSDPLWISKAGHMVGASSCTLNYNVNFSRFEFMLLHQPYINPVKELVGSGSTIGGDESAFILFPNENIFQTDQRYKMSSVYTNSVWGKFSGINVENWCASLKTFNNYRDFYNASIPHFLDLTKLDPDGVRFMNKIGYKNESLLENVGWDGGYNVLDTSLNAYQFYQPLGTTTNSVDISNSFVPSDEAPTNYQRPNQAPGGTNPITIAESFQQGSYGGLGFGWGTIAGSSDYDTFGSIDNNHMGGNLPPTTGEPLIYNPSVSGTYNIIPDFNPDCRIFMGYTIDADTSSIMADLLPEKNNSPYYLLLCPEISGGNNFYSTRANGSVSPNVCSIISRLNAEQDFVFSYQSPITFYAKQDIILSSLTCKILMPDYSPPSNLSANSSVIFQVVRESPQPPYVPPTFGEIQADAFNQLAVAENTMRHLTSQESGAQNIRNGVMQISSILSEAGLHPYANSGASFMTRIQTIAEQNGLTNMTQRQRRAFMNTPQGAEILNLLDNVNTMAAGGSNPIPIPNTPATAGQDPLTAVMSIDPETLGPDDPEATLVQPTDVKPSTPTPPPSTPPPPIDDMPDLPSRETPEEKQQRKRADIERAVRQKAIVIRQLKIDNYTEATEKLDKLRELIKEHKQENNPQMHQAVRRLQEQIHEFQGYRRPHLPTTGNHHHRETHERLQRALTPSEDHHHHPDEEHNPDAGRKKE